MRERHLFVFIEKDDNIPINTSMEKSYLDIKQYVSKLLLLLLIFVGTGLALSFSISYSYSILQGRNIGEESTYLLALNLFFKQLIAIVIGLAGIVYVLKTPTKILRKSSSVLIILAGIAMIYTAFIGPEINGSRRWLVFSGVSIQTGDFARLAVVLYLSDLFAQYHRVVYQQSVGMRDQEKKMLHKLILRVIICLFVYGGTLYLQHDYSSFMISSVVVMSLVLVSDIPLRWKIGGVAIGIGVFFVIVLSDANRMQRVLHYFSKDGDPLGIGFQIQKSYEIIRSGGFFGGGVGSSMLDVLRLPYFNNDFVFSIIIGEYGIIGALLVILLFALMCVYAYKIANYLYKVDRYYYFLLLASTVNIIVSAVAHIIVTLGLVPTAGLNLPFYSSGGSSMVSSLLSYGLILRGAVAVYYHEKNKNRPPIIVTKNIQPILQVGEHI